MSEHNIDNLAGKDPSKSAIAKLIAWSVANQLIIIVLAIALACLLYTSPSPRDRTRSRMPSSA